MWYCIGRKYSALFFFFSPAVSGFLAQGGPSLSASIDSLYQASWSGFREELDDRGYSRLLGVSFSRKDTVIMEKRPLALSGLPVVHPSGALLGGVPITPYSMMNSKNGGDFFFYGENSLIFNQISFSDWSTGGDGSLGILAKVNFNLGYRGDSYYLSSDVLLGYGMLRSQSQSARKTDDYIKVTTNYGYRLRTDYYFSAGFQLHSQFSPGYDYSLTPSPHYHDRISNFMAPAYLSVGFGGQYNPRENFQIIFRPVNAKTSIVLDPKLQKSGLFGLSEDGKSYLVEIGAMFSLAHKFNLFKDLYYKSKLDLFGRYQSVREWIDVSYAGELNLRLSKYIKAKISLDLVYDMDQSSSLQVKQSFGAGFSYDIGIKSSGSDSKNKFIRFF